MNNIFGPILLMQEHLMCQETDENKIYQEGKNLQHSPLVVFLSIANIEL